MPAAYDNPWSDAHALAAGCNATLQAAVEAALQVPADEGVGYSPVEYYGVWACRFSDDASLSKAAKKLWPTLNSYGYYPSRWFALFAVVVFGLSVLLHLYQLWKSRRWGYISVIFAGALEIAGWCFRYEGAVDVRNGYVLQLAMLTIAPTFYAGGIYTLFYLAADARDRSLMPLVSPKVFTWTIFAVEVVTIAIQAAGGAIAAITSDRDVFKVGTRIMTAGTALQLATSVAFSVLFGIYFTRLRNYTMERFAFRSRTGRIFWGILAMETLLIIRGAYRTAELSEGLFGKVASSQIGLILGDTVPMLVVSIILNLVHPLWTVPRDAFAHGSIPLLDTSYAEDK
ncbi:hypothetical protein JCM10908_007241 [Rhodotorula pacifica]|uniref:uncharacterized protein n=1 Tax=Rhodotorula pacifica TaxID=1495444 RepID=UPI00318179CC